jgi:hypothetical protein
MKEEGESDRNTWVLFFKSVFGFDKIRRISVRGGNE